MNRLVCGVGKKGNTSVVDRNGKRLRSYRVWCDILRRCYVKYQQKKQPTYKDYSVSKEWLEYPNFKKWFDENYIENYHLDKDLLNSNNKMYSKNNCVFVPQSLNNLFIDSAKARGQYKIGVHRKKRETKYSASYRENGVLRFIGSYDSEEEAHTEYRKSKKRYCTREINKYYKNNEISRNLYLTLIRRIAFI